MLQYSTDGTNWTKINPKSTTLTIPEGSKITENPLTVENTFILPYESAANERLLVDELFDLPAASEAGTLYIEAKVNHRASCDLAKLISTGNGATSRIGRFASIEFTVDD